jgi:hypothetical protein
MLHSLSAEAKLFYCIYYSLLELLGDDQVDEIFASANLDPFDLTAPHYFRRGKDLIDSIAAQLLLNFGEETSRGLLIRMGGASLTFFRKYFSEIAQLGNIENRLKPLDRRFLSSLKTLAAVLSSEMGTEINVNSSDSGCFEWQAFYANSQQNPREFIPFFYFGLLEEFCNWLDTRKNYLLNYAPDIINKNFDLITIEIRNLE